MDSGTYGNSYTFYDVTMNHTVDVVYVPNSYTVTYNINGGDSGTTADSSHSYDVDGNLTANGYIKAGTEFADGQRVRPGCVYTDDKV